LADLKTQLYTNVDSITEQDYQAAIPGGCRLRTYEEHCEIMLCWGLVHQIKNNSDTTPCGMCEFNAEPAGDFARIAWHEEQSKKRVWEQISR